jgi:hypothetical protein
MGISKERIMTHLSELMLVGLLLDVANVVQIRVLPKLTIGVSQRLPPA